MYNKNNIIEKRYKVAEFLTNPTKYIGKSPEIILRSSWEVSLAKYMDRRENVIEWSNEDIVIQYESSIDGRRHRYIVDFYMKVKTFDGKVKEFLIEVKPMRECTHPQYILKEGMQEKTKVEIIETYVKNQDKWKAAETYCKKKGWGFKILTEVDILRVKQILKSEGVEISDPKDKTAKTAK